MADAVIVVGRQGGGKTRCASEIARHFALKRIVDDGFGFPFPTIRRGDLVLTNCRPESVPDFATVVEFDELVAAHPDLSLAIRA